MNQIINLATTKHTLFAIVHVGDFEYHIHVKDNGDSEVEEYQWKQHQSFNVNFDPL